MGRKPTTLVVGVRQTYCTRNYRKSEEQEKDYICPICGKTMGQEENESEDYIEVWTFCRNCGFRTSSRYYYDQYCEENNEKKKKFNNKKYKKLFK